MGADKERAKRVIVEILRQAGGELGKTKLFKAFWLAHLYYFKIDECCIAEPATRKCWYAYGALRSRLLHIVTQFPLTLNRTQLM
jgi:hypothetical protein